MASTSEILQTLLSKPPSTSHGIAYNYLVPNIRGLENLVRIRSSQNNTGYPTPSSSPKPEQQGYQGPITSASNPNDMTSATPVPPTNTTEVSLFAAATEEFSKANTNCSIAESLERCKPIMELAKQNDIRVRGYVSVALGCPVGIDTRAFNMLADHVCSMLVPR